MINVLSNESLLMSNAENKLFMPSKSRHIPSHKPYSNHHLTCCQVRPVCVCSCVCVTYIPLPHMSSLSPQELHSRTRDGHSCPSPPSQCMERVCTGLWVCVPLCLSAGEHVNPNTQLLFPDPLSPRNKLDYYFPSFPCSLSSPNITLDSRVLKVLKFFTSFKSSPRKTQSIYSFFFLDSAPIVRCFQKYTIEECSFNLNIN